MNILLEMFLPGSDLTPLEQSIDDIINGLTKWKPCIEGRIKCAPVKVTIEGNDYFETITRLNNTFLKKQMGRRITNTPCDRRASQVDINRNRFPEGYYPGQNSSGGQGSNYRITCSQFGDDWRTSEFLPILVATVKAFLNPLFGAVTLQTTQVCIPCCDCEWTYRPTNTS